MNRSCRSIVAVFSVAAGAVMAFSGCSKSSGARTAELPPAEVAAVPGSSFHRVTLSAQAVDRLGIQIGKVVSGGPAAHSERIIPYAAVLYDANGNASAYTNPEVRTFVRQSIVIDRVSGDQAILSDGPSIGTAVVSVGAAELFGVESGVGEG